MKKLSILLTALCFLAIINKANAQTWQIGLPNAADVTATLSGGTLTISGTGAMQMFTQGGAPWYDVRNSIHSLKLMYGINNIGDYAFYDCEQLTNNFTIPSSVHGIGKSAFYLCGFTSITIPLSVVAIDNFAFYNCNHLNTIACTSASPSSISLGTQVFGAVPASCILRVRTSAVGAFVTTPQWDAFTVYGPTSSFNIGTPNPPDVTAQLIGNTLLISGSGKMQDFMLFDLPWYGGEPWYSVRNSITAFTIENGITNIGACAFEGCSAIQDASDIPGSVSTISSLAFHDCTGLLSVAIPGSVNLLDGAVFQNCSALPSVFIPASVTSLSVGLCGGCTALKSIDVAQTNANYSSTDGVLFNKNQSTLIEYPAGKYGAYTIPSTVNTLDMISFTDCHNLTAVVIPNSVTTIKQSAFNNCDGLNSITTFHALPNEMTLGTTVFAGVNTSNCTLFVPSSSAVPAYHGAAQWSDFSDIQGPLKWNIGTPTPANLTATLFGGTLTVSGSGEMYDFDYMEDPTPWNQHDTDYDLRKIIIEPGVTSIGDCAFALCYDVTGTVDIPSSVTSIGITSFYYCINLTSVTLPASPASVTSIGQSAFQMCSKLESINIPASVTSIDIGAFAACSSLTSIDLPASVSSIGDEAFINCTAMTAINVNAANLHYSSAGGILFNKTQTRLMAYPTGKGGNYVIPSTVSQIDQYAFFGCSGLNSVTIPENISSIGNSVFSGCTGLTSITCLNPTPANISMGYFVFSLVNTSTCELNVPYNTKPLYSDADQWKDFLIINELPPTSVDNNRINSLQIYPNPAISELNINNYNTDTNNYSIVDMNGKIILNGKLSGQTTTVNVSSFASGIYFINAGGAKAKFIKQ